MFICRKIPKRADPLVEQYRDYNETTVRRLNTDGSCRADRRDRGFADPSGKGFDWTVGGKADRADAGRLGETHAGASLLRGGPMGHAAALQMRAVAADTTPDRSGASTASWSRSSADGSGRREAMARSTCHTRSSTIHRPRRSGAVGLLPHPAAHQPEVIERGGSVAMTAQQRWSATRSTTSTLLPSSTPIPSSRRGADVRRGRAPAGGVWLLVTARPTRRRCTRRCSL